MANLGIDISSDYVRVALLRVSYRSTAIVALEEEPIANHPSVDAAIRHVVAPLLSRGDSISTLLPGDRLFIRKIELPRTALRQLNEVLPFELEAQLPFDMDEALYDSLVLPRDAKSPISVLTCASRIEQVRERIGLIKQAVGVEPERVEASPFALANLVALVPELGAVAPIAIIHLDSTNCDVVIMRNGKVEFVRTVTGGTAGLPASAKPLARDVRQSFLAWRSQGGDAPQSVYLTGAGSLIAGAAVYLSAECGMPIVPLPVMRADGLSSDLAQKLPVFSRPIALALGLRLGSSGVNLRKGPLVFERGYRFLQDKVPLIAGIAALIVASFGFATWMEFRAISYESAVLEEALAMVTQDVTGEAIRDPQTAEESVSASVSKTEDPMPTIDGFDLMVAISKAVPPEMKHDIEEFDYQKGKATIHGIVDTIPDAQQVATRLDTVRCFENVKIVRTNQVINENRQKYVLEFEVKCPTDGADKKNGGNETASKDKDGDK